MNKINTLRGLGLLGAIIFLAGAIWEIGDKYPDILRNIVIDIIIPPTYRILELLGLIILSVSIYYIFQSVKSDTEKIE